MAVSHTTKTRFILLTTIVAFIAPIVIAFFLYQHKNLLPRPEIEKYALNPPIQVSELDFKHYAGEQQIKQLPEKWTLVLTDPYQCANSACQLHATHATDQISLREISRPTKCIY